MEKTPETVLVDLESLAFADYVSHEQVDDLITRVANLGDSGADVLFDELQHGILTSRKEALIIHVIRQLGFGLRKELLPGKHFGYWVFDGVTSRHIMPDVIFPDYYLSHDSELSEMMTVDEWKTRVEIFQRQRR
ncbi:MAG: hypothetical protein H7145_24150 [Akkermansiaceae bacterium]|nr:hypothetical protein [Armatimonadota bacterium]